MASTEESMYRRLRERQQENAELYAKHYLPHWLAPVVSFLGLHFLELSLLGSFLVAVIGWWSLESFIIQWQKTVLWL